MKFIALLAALLFPAVALAQGAGYSQPPLAGPFGTASGSTAWSGTHNSIPRKNLAGVVNGATTCNATTAPFSSFGNFGITVTGANCLISCPSSIVMGDMAIFHITEGAGSNLIKFDPVCYGWVGKTALGPTVSGNDIVTCEFMSPVNADGTSAVCTALANVGTAVPKAFVASVMGTACGANVNTCAQAVSFAAGTSAVCAVNYFGSPGPAITSMVAGGNTFTALNTVTDAQTDVLATFGFAGFSGAPTTVTVNFASATAQQPQITCLNYSGITAIEQHTINVQNGGSGGGTDAMTSTSAGTTTSADDILVGIGVNGTGGETVAAGTGFTPRGTDSAVYVIRVEDRQLSGTGAAVATFTSTPGTHHVMSAVVALH